MSQSEDLLREIQGKIEAYFEPHELNLKARFVDNGILVEWNPFNSEGSDLLYYAEELHDKWQHSVRRYTGQFNTRIGEILIGTKDGRENYTWHFKLVSGEDEWTTALKKESEIRTSLWDSSENNYQDFEAVRVRNFEELREVKDLGKFIIFSLSHRWYTHGGLKDKAQWENILKRAKAEIEGIENLELFLQDEPISNDVWGNTIADRLNNLESLIKMCREIMPDTRIGMSIKRSNFMKNPVPRWLDFYITPNYPFYRKDLDDYGNGYPAIETKDQFIEYFEEQVQISKSKIDGDLYLIGQGFRNVGDSTDPEYQRRWRQAPLWYPSELYNQCKKYNIKSVWWWLYKSDEYKKWDGLDRMPELYEEIVRVNH